MTARARRAWLIVSGGVLLGVGGIGVHELVLRSGIWPYQACLVRLADGRDAALLVGTASLWPREHRRIELVDLGAGRRLARTPAAHRGSWEEVCRPAGGDRLWCVVQEPDRLPAWMRKEVETHTATVDLRLLRLPDLRVVKELKGVGDGEIAGGAGLASVRVRDGQAELVYPPGSGYDRGDDEFPRPYEDWTRVRASTVVAAVGQNRYRLRAQPDGDRDRAVIVLGDPDPTRCCDENWGKPVSAGTTFRQAWFLVEAASRRGEAVGLPDGFVIQHQSDGIPSRLQISRVRLDGTVVWTLTEKERDWVMLSHLAGESLVLVLKGDSSRVLAIDWRSGKVRWRYAVG